MSTEKNQDKDEKFHLIVNKVEKLWEHQLITGADIKVLNGSPADWVVNQLVSGPGDDPEIAAAQQVDLDEKAVPHGIKRFQVRKPATNPGS